MDKDLIEMAKEAKDVDALIRLASDNGVDLSRDKAERYFVALKREEPLADDELDSVAGGEDNCLDKRQVRVSVPERKRKHLH